MKLRFTAAIILFVTLLIFADTNVTQASWSSMNSGFAVTTNYHGLDVPFYEDVNATAGTDDSEVLEVEFLWKNPDDEIVWSETQGLSWITTPAVPENVPQEVKDWAEMNPGVNVGYAQSTYGDMDAPGWWTIQAIFHGPTGPKGQDQTKIKASSFFVIDEVPFGTIVVLLIPFGFLGIYAIKRKHSIPIDARA